MSVFVSGKDLWDQSHSGKQGRGKEGEEPECIAGIPTNSNAHITWSIYFQQGADLPSPLSFPEFFL